MTITFKVRALSILLLVATIAFGSLVWKTSENLKDKHDDNNIFQQIIKSVSELNFMTNELVKSDKDPRVELQWKNTHDALAVLLNRAQKVISNADDKASIEKILTNEVQTKEIFNKLGYPGEVNKEPSSKEDSSNKAQAASQINTHMRAMISESLAASHRSLKRLKETEEMLSLVSLLVVVVFMFILSAVLVLINKRIITPIIALQNAAKRVSLGNYNEEIVVTGKDEVSELAKCCNHLIKDVNKKLASITSQSERLKESQRDISNLNNSLKKIVLDQTLDLQKSEHQQRAVLDSMSDGVVTMNSDFLITDINRSVCEIFSYSENELVGESINFLLSHYPGNQVFTSIYLEAYGKHKTDGLFPIEVSLNEMSINDVEMYSCIIRDNSRRKRTEKVMSEFVSTVSHELRTPLTSINGALKLITSGILGELPEKVN